MPVKGIELSQIHPFPTNAHGPVSWIHIGDLHMTRAGEQNEIDLGRIVDVINELYAGHGVSFVYLPGDVADDGSASAYSVVRSHLDRLSIPWCGIVGDHDVHEESFDNFRTYIAGDLTSAFTLGPYRFFRLNAFSEPRPDSFIVDAGQLTWIEEELRSCEQVGLRAVLFLHCYPSDLKQGGQELTQLIRSYPVLLVDMGHTHYNELSNDGHLLYSATRSTGQIEEGSVGFSVVTLDGDTVSWHFVPLDAPELVAITAPSDRRLEVNCEQSSPSDIAVRAKVWSRDSATDVSATLDGLATGLRKNADGLWSGMVSVKGHPPGKYRLIVQAITESGSHLASAIEIIIGWRPGQEHAPLDQDNTIGPWEERGILGTQLGPNKNGRKW